MHIIKSCAKVVISDFYRSIFWTQKLDLFICYTAISDSNIKDKKQSRGLALFYSRYPCFIAGYVLLSFVDAVLAATTCFPFHAIKSGRGRNKYQKRKSDSWYIVLNKEYTFVCIPS